MLMLELLYKFSQNYSVMSCMKWFNIVFSFTNNEYMNSSPFPWGIILVTTIFNSGYVGILASCLFVAKLSTRIGFNCDSSEIQHKITKKNFLEPITRK